MTQEKENPPSESPDETRKTLSNSRESTEVKTPSTKFSISSSAFESLETDEALEELGRELREEAKTRAPAEFRKYTEFEVPKGCEEIERYWVRKPYVWASIVHDPERNENVYYLVEPTLSPGEKSALRLLHENLIDRLSYDESIEDRDRVLRQKTAELLASMGYP